MDILSWDEVVAVITSAPFLLSALVTVCCYALHCCLPLEEGRAPAGVEESFFRLREDDLAQSCFSGATQSYRWNQSEAEVEVVIPVPAATRSKDVQCRIRTGSLSLSLSGSMTPIVEGELFRRVSSDDCDWSLDGKGDERVVRVTLVKQKETHGSKHWTSLLLDSKAKQQ